jgi:hypothetical protein
MTKPTRDLPAHCTCCIVTPDGYVIGAEPAAIPALLAELRKSPHRTSFSTTSSRRSQRSSGRSRPSASRLSSAQVEVARRDQKGRTPDEWPEFVEI